MHFVLALILITGDGIQPPRNIEMPSLEKCLSTLKNIMEKVEADKMREAGYVGYGAGCIVTMDPSQDTKS